jgi:hypothetical protein
VPLRINGVKPATSKSNTGTATSCAARCAAGHAPIVAFDTHCEGAVVDGTVLGVDVDVDVDLEVGVAVEVETVATDVLVAVLPA